MRRAVPVIAAVLLTAGCAGITPHTAAAPSPSPSATRASQTTTASLTSSEPAGTAPSGTHTAITAQDLPYKPAAGAPTLDDVSISTSVADPCGIPADDSGNEAQLLNITQDGNVLIVTFEFTNPCTAPLAYNFEVAQAIGSATGQPGGPAVNARTPVIQPRQSISFNVNVDPDSSLTTAQLRQLWVGVTHIAKA